MSKKLFIAVPCMDQIPARFAQSLAMLRRDGEAQVGFQIGSLVYSSRNDLAKTAIRIEADEVLWLDSDMVFDPDLLIRMRKIMYENDLDFLTGIYFRRNPPYSTVLFDRLERVDEKCSYSTFESIPDGLFEVGGCGFGGVLMKTDVLMDVAGKFGRLFDPLPSMGEDISFCWRARQCGYKIFAESSLLMGHVGYNVVTKDYFEAFRRDKKEA